MNTRRGLGIAALASLAAVAVTTTGCQHNASSPRDTGRVQAAPERMTEAAVEYRTVEVKEPLDKERAISQMREKMQEFQRAGWTVLSVSKPLPQQDGTVLRKYRLSRAKQ